MNTIMLKNEQISIHELQAGGHLNPRHMSLITSNIRSISKNLGKFEKIINTLPIQPTIIILSEGWLKQRLLNTAKDSYNLKKYNAYFTHNNKNRNDGVIAYIKKEITKQIVSEMKIVDTEITDHYSAIITLKSA